VSQAQPQGGGGRGLGGTTSVRVRLPAQLQVLASTRAELSVQVQGPVTQRTVLDALERLHPALRGTVRDRATARRRAFIRFFVGETDLSNADPDDLLPTVVVAGTEALVVVGAMAGG